MSVGGAGAGARRVRALGGLCAAGAVLLAAPSARAQGAPPGPIIVQAAPLLGATSGAGWSSYAVRLANTSDQPIEGRVDLVSDHTWGSAGGRASTRAPFVLPPRGRATLELPMHGSVSMPPAVEIAVVAQSGAELARLSLPAARGAQPLLFDLSMPSRLKPALQNAPLPVSLRGPHGSYGTPMLAVTNPEVSPATGDPVLPERTSGYAGATLVLARSDELARLAGARLEALASWVLAGGTLALVITRPEDLRSPALVALTGGPLEDRGGAARELSREAVFEVLVEDATGSYGTRRLERRRAAPSESVRQALRTYGGGNLRVTPWGSAASYGLGELHLLAFDATREPAASDLWARYRLLELIEHAHNRKVHVAFPHGEVALDDPEVWEVRRLLDPNQGTRWSIAVATLLLIAYSLLAGPLNFHLAARRGRPLRALIVLPVASLVTLVAIVLLGIASKGIRGQARHLTLLEAGAGMPRAAVTRFRGFYAASASQLGVRVTERGSVLDLAGEGEGSEHELVVDRDGLRLGGLRSKPWQTLLVREDGFAPLGAGISVVERGGKTWVKNRTGRDLLGAIVVLPDAPFARHFARIKDGESVEAEAGSPLPPPHGGGSYAGLDPDTFADAVEKDAEGLGAAWRALAKVAPDETVWWPDVPVVLGQVAGGEGRLVDSGLNLTVDRVLVRVVGWGGNP